MKQVLNFTFIFVKEIPRAFLVTLSEKMKYDNSKKLKNYWLSQLETEGWFICMDIFLFYIYKVLYYLKIW